MKISKSLTSALIAATLVLTGCSGDGKDAAEKATSAVSSAASAAKKEAAKPAAAYPVTVTDAGGNEITIEKAPERIVILNYQALDFLDALGFGDKIVGMASGKFTNPGVVAKYEGKAENIGSMFTPDMEKIAALKPDLIITGLRSRKVVDEVKKIAPTVDLRLDFSDVYNSNLKNTEIIGKVMGVEDKAKADADAMKKKFDDYKAKISAAAPTALMIMTAGGEMSAFNPGSRFGLVYDLGYKQAAAVAKSGPHGDAISFEFIKDANPDYLFVLDRDGAMNKGHEAAEATLNNELVQSTNAAKNGHIVYLSGGEWYLIGGGFTTMNTMLDEVGGAFDGK